MTFSIQKCVSRIHFITYGSFSLLCNIQLCEHGLAKKFAWVFLYYLTEKKKRMNFWANPASQLIIFSPILDANAAFNIFL